MIEYAKELGAVIESRDPERLKTFVKAHKDIYRPDVYEAFMRASEDTVKLTLAKMALCRVDISVDTKDWAWKTIEEWRKNGSKKERINGTQM